MLHAVFSSPPLRSLIYAMSAGYLSSGVIGSRLRAQCGFVTVLCGAMQDQTHAASGSNTHGVVGDPGPGSHGPPSRLTSSRTLSDPQTPQQVREELETVSQF